MDALKDKKLREKYQEALKLEVDLFTKKIHNYKMTRTSGINTVKIVGRKRIVCAWSFC